MGDLLIVGIDPGTTLGYAVLDINKKIIEINSSKELNLNALIKKISEIGSPIIVGTNKKKKKKNCFIRKFAAQFNAKLVAPKEDLKIEDKNELTRDYKLNSHQRDALAAALCAYSKYERLFSKIDYHLKEFDKEVIEEVRKLCVKEELNIALSLDMVTNKQTDKKEVNEIKKIIHKDELKKDLIFLYEKIKKQNKSIKLLQKTNKQKEDYIKKIKERDAYLITKINQLVPDKKAEELLNLRENLIISMGSEIKSKEENIDYLRKEIDKIYDFFSDLGNNYLVKKLKNLGYEEFMSKNRILKIKKNDILLVDNIDIANNRILEFMKDKVRIIIYKNGTRKFKDFILIKCENLNIKEDRYFALVNKEELKKEENNFDMLKDIVLDYKRTRLASIHHNKQL